LKKDKFHQKERVFVNRRPPLKEWEKEVLKTEKKIIKEGLLECQKERNNIKSK